MKHSPSQSPSLRVWYASKPLDYFCCPQADHNTRLVEAMRPAGFWSVTAQRARGSPLVFVHGGLQANASHTHSTRSLRPWASLAWSWLRASVSQCTTVASFFFFYNILAKPWPHPHVFSKTHLFLCILAFCLHVNSVLGRIPRISINSSCCVSVRNMMSSQLDFPLAHFVCNMALASELDFLTFHRIFIGFLLISNSICMLRSFFCYPVCCASPSSGLEYLFDRCSCSADRIFIKCSLVLAERLKGKLHFGEFRLLYLYHIHVI